ncbi:MAG: hypothetical protein B6D61_07810, partial [Bacteroidetes bacterium 4484_249]
AISAKFIFTVSLFPYFILTSVSATLTAFKAAESYERIFNKYPDSKDAEPSLYNASYYYVKAEDWNNAIRINDKYIATYPDAAASVDLYFDKAKYYLKLDNIVEANKVYEQFALKKGGKRC